MTSEPSKLLTLSNPDDWIFFAKGNANLVYKYIGINTPHLIKNRTLLRLRQKGQEYDTKIVYEFTGKVRKDFPELITLTLARVTFQIEGGLNDGFGLLMENIIPDSAQIKQKTAYYTIYTYDHGLVVEIKPKWLRKTRYGCRNCAHHRYKHGDNADWCVLSLLGDSDTIEKTLRNMHLPPKACGPLTGYMESDDSVLKKLQRRQRPLDELETLKEAQVNDELCYQMSLRDTTVFFNLKIEGQEWKYSDVVMTDFDPKSSKKWRHWVSTERKLIQDFY